jgi:beta-1,4-mannosyl-glycoprotein beta-1,4-N-acetylglucosaminyltransferase
MIIDTTLFNNEFDMLDIHLAITSHYVDRWIILEADRTFSGLPKSYNLTQRLAEYNQRWGGRIQTICLPLDSDQVNWACETAMRQGFREALATCDAQDIVIHGDLDEIIDPTHWLEICELMDTAVQPVSCGMDMYFYRLDQRAERGWKGSVVARRSMFDTPHELYKGPSIKRKNRAHCVGLAHPVGWHWTWMGDDAAVRHKVRACIESQHRDPEQVLAAFKELDTTSAINHKCSSAVVDTQYPPQVQAVLAQYPHLWHHPPR